MVQKILTTVLLLLFYFSGHTQKTKIIVTGLVTKAEKYFNDKHYDSALISLEKAEKLVQKNSLFADGISSILYNQEGLVYKELNNVSKSHYYLSLALNNARKYGHPYENQQALLSLCTLHKFIREKDIAFSYPVVNEKEKAVVHFPVSKVDSTGDSLIVTINGGTLDGIAPNEKSMDLYTHISAKDTFQHNDIAFVSSARVINISPNTSVLKAKNNGIAIFAGDLAAVHAQVPLSWRKLSLRNLLLNNLYLVNNYKEYPFHYRFYYYYADSLIEKESFETFQASVNEVVELFAKDTATNEELGGKIQSGIFTGYNAITAMKKSQPQHLKLFLNFVNSFPAKYISNNYRFSETYATWVINNTPLNSNDVKTYLLGFPGDEDLKREAMQLSAQIEENKLTQQWFDEGMQKTIIDDIKEARKNSRLLRLVSSYSKSAQGWTEILAAQIENRLANKIKADSILNLAEIRFKELNNIEGLTWLKNTKLQWKKSDKINVSIQNGHIFPYTVTTSNNPRYFATSGMDNLIKIWDRNLGKEILTLTDHTDEVTDLNFSKNGRYMVSTSLDSFINVYNAYDYSLMYSHKVSAPERSIRFSNDSKYIVSAGRDSLIKFRDIQTGNIIKTLKLHKSTVNGLCFHPRFENILYSAGSDSMLYKWDTDSGEMIRWYKSKGKVLSIKLSNDGKYLSTVSTDSMLTIRNTETHKVISKFRINAFPQGNNTYYASESFSPDSRYICFPTAKDSFVMLQLEDNYQRIYGTSLKDYYLADMEYSADGFSVYARFNMGGPLRVYNFAGWDIRNNTTINYKDIHSFANTPMALQFTNDDNNLVILHNELSKIDLRNGKNEPLFYSPTFIENKYLLLNDERLSACTEFSKNIIAFYDYKQKKNEKEFSLPDGEIYASFEVSKNNKLCFIGSEKGIISGWDTESNKLLFSRKYSQAANNAISKLFYDHYKNRLLALTTQNKMLLISPTDGDVKDSINLKGPSYISATQRYIYITDEDGFLNKYDAESLLLIKRMALNNNHQFAYQLQLSPDEKILYAQSGYTSVSAVETISDSVLFTLNDHTNQLTSIAVSHDGSMLASAGFDSHINLYNALTGKKIVNIYLPKDRNCMIADDEGYYMTSKNTLDAIIFSYNRNAYTFDQFDVKLNRPDMILKKIGRADSIQLNIYSLAHKKRLSKLGMDEQNIKAKLQLPMVRLTDKSEVQPITTQSKYSLSVECSDNNYPLKSLQVLVNNSPVLGMAGIDLSKFNSRELVQKITIPLARGNNSIRVYCTNSMGINSLKESFDIISNYESKRDSRLYFVGIGVANYKDAGMNLKYSAKDIRDLAKTFYDLYSNIVIDTLIDAAVTRENILAIKKKLLATDVNDKVIVAVTGHGILDKSFDFYYATWDMNFAEPNKRGVKYEDLEGLMNDVPAQRKLLLIDACHSGALDKEELLADKTEITWSDSSSQVNGTAPRGIIKLVKKDETTNSSFQVMQNLFADLSGSNGAVVISAAGGMEYALESARWNNGVFTYCVRKGITEKMADRDGGNYDGKVSVQELQQYVSKKVNELTNGKQQPTSRRENVDFEWWLRF